MSETITVLVKAKRLIDKPEKWYKGWNVGWNGSHCSAGAVNVAATGNAFGHADVTDAACDALARTASVGNTISGLMTIHGIAAQTRHLQ